MISRTDPHGGLLHVQESFWLEPIQLGSLENCPIAIVMAPLNPSARPASPQCAGAVECRYYCPARQCRVIISESDPGSAPSGQGYAWTPGHPQRRAGEGWMGGTA